MSRRRMNRTRLTQPIQSKLPIKSQSRIDKDHANPMPIQLTRERARNKFTTISIIQHDSQYRIATHWHCIGSALTKVTPIYVNRRTFVHVTWELVNYGDPTEVSRRGSNTQTAHSYDTTTLQLKHKCTANTLPIHLTVIKANPPSINRYRLARARSITTPDWSPIGKEKVNT